MSMPVGPGRPPASVSPRAVPRFAIAIGLLTVALFVPAGGLDWPMAWAWVAMTAGGMTWTTVKLVRSAPDLLEERMRVKPDAKRWDVALSSLQALILPIGLCVVAGLDRRFGWTRAGPETVAVGSLVVSATGSLLIHRAMLANRFFSGVVRIQRDRGHYVITAGPYRFVRHPGYVGVLLFYLPLPLVLGSAWAWIPAGLILAVTVARTTLEDRTLHRELDGYARYSRTVRYRLIPGVW